MSEELNNKLIGIMNSKNMSDDIKDLSFSEKETIFLNYNSNFIMDSFIKTCILRKVKLFNQEEYEKLMNNEKITKINFKEYALFVFPSKMNDLLFSKYESTFNSVYLSYISDIEALIDFIKQKKPSNVDLILSSLSDEMIEKLLLSGKISKYNSKLILSFKSREMIIKYFNQASNDVKIRVAYKIGDDRLLKSLIDLKTINTNNLISRLSSDEDKKKYLKKYMFLLNGELKSEIICSLSSDEDKEYYLKKYSFILDDYSKYMIISSIKDSNIIIRNAHYLKNHHLANIILNKLSFDTQLEDIKKLYERLDEKTIVENIDLIDKIDKKIPGFAFKNINSKRFISAIFDYSGDMHFSDETVQVLLDKVDSYFINWYVKRHLEDWDFDYRLLLKCTDEKLIIDLIDGIPSEVDYSDNLKPIFEIVSKEYNLNLDHLIELSKICGCGLLHHLNEENILYAINLSDDSFKKYLQIFSDENINATKSDVSTILTALLQQSYALKNKEESQIAMNTLRAFQDENDYYKGTQNILAIANVINLTDYGLDSNSLINGLINNDKKMISKFRLIADKYVMLKRNEYVNNNLDSAFDKVLEWEYDSNALLKYVFKVLPEDLIVSRLANVSDLLTLEMHELFKNKDLLKCLIKYRKNPNSFAYSSKDIDINKKLVTNEMKANMKLFNEMCLIAFNDYSKEHIIDEKLPKRHSKQKHYKFSLIALMSNIETQKLDETLIQGDPLTFEKMLGELKKYKMTGFGSTYSSIANECDCELEEDNIGTFIAYYDLICKELENSKEKNDSLVLKLAISSAICGNANIYTQLLGFENYNLIKINTYPNRAKLRKEERLSKAIDALITMHNRKDITVPSIDENIELSSGKEINILLGNTNDPINLTYGERTGACMRIGGTAEKLFNFCLSNENGFHISFNDPKTGKFISRVSCFRNGNSVFLNQLRFPKGSSYSDEDIREACKKAAQMIIEMTKDSKYPVENVITSSEVLFHGFKGIDLNCDDIRRGFNESLNCDIKESNAIVLSTTSKDSDYVPIVLGPNKTEKYKTIRSKVKYYDINESKNKKANDVARIEALDLLFDGETIDNIEVEQKDVFEAYVGEDWYVARLEDGNVISYIQRNSLNLEEAKKEVDYYLAIMKQNQIKKQEEIANGEKRGL